MAGPRAGLLAALLLGCVVAAGGQQAPGERRTFRSGVELTTVNATVRDQNGQLVRGLPREAFDVYEDGRLQAVTQFTNERVAVSLGILLDISDSMFGRRLEEARDAIAAFVVEMLAPDDEFGIIAFNHQPHFLTKWTEERPAAARVMQPLKAFGSTAIYDAIASALPMVETRTRQRAALLVISDGADTASDLTLRDLRSALLRSDVFVYAIAIDASTSFAINTQVNPTALKEITDQSGGRTIVVHDSSEASSALAEVAEELNSQYLIGYSSAKAADGQYHSIRVRVRGTDHRVRARNGYVAKPRRPPSEN